MWQAKQIRSLFNAANKADEDDENEDDGEYDVQTRSNTIDSIEQLQKHGMAMASR